MAPVPRGCATTVSSRPLGPGSGARGGSLPRPQRLQHAQNCIEVLMLRTRSGSQINQYTATSARKSAKKASSDLRAFTPERIDQVHHAHRKTNKKAERTHPFFRSHVLATFSNAMGGHILASVLTALAVLVGFAGPTLLRIKQVSALKVLRRELDPLPPAAWLVVGVASIVFGGLLWLYSGSFPLALALLVGGSALLALLWGVSSLLLKGLLRAVQRLKGGGEWVQAFRLGGRQLARRKQAGLGQLLAFSVTFFAMAMIVLVRGDLLITWQDQLPEDTPNYFAINIQPGERDAFEQAVAPRVDTQSTLYPMVRGRITEINGQAPRDAVPADARGDTPREVPRVGCVAQQAPPRAGIRGLVARAVAEVRQG